MFPGAGGGKYKVQLNQKNNAKSFTKIKYIVLEGSIKSKMPKILH